MTPWEPALLDYATHREGAVRSLRLGGASADRVGRIASRLDDHLVQRCLRTEIERIEAESGPLGVPWAWVVFGSDGRREQPMLVDQHNAMVFDPHLLDPDAAATASETFHRLAKRVSERLRASGLPEPSDGFVAHRWCSTLVEWRRRFRHWLEEPDAESLEHAQVFFDLRRVTGMLDVERPSTLSAAEPPADFLRLLTAMAARRRPAVRRWRGLTRNGDGEVDLVEGGLRPLVALARVAGLALGDPDLPCSTPGRIEAVARRGLLPGEDGDRLLDVYGSLTDRILDLQLMETAVGKAPTACQRPAELGRQARHRLASDLRFVRRQQAALDGLVRHFSRAAARAGDAR